MTSFFNVSALTGNPFATPVGQRIEQATDASLEAENWALNIEICDMINESSDSARDAMKAIRKRLTQSAGKNDAVIMLTLTVIETCVKNCGKAFHSLVASKEFIQELVKLIGPKNDPSVAVQERVLSLIQMWADAFRSQPDLNGVVQMYHELKSKGIEFPATDPEATAPIFTPQRSVPETQQPQPAVTVPPQQVPPVGTVQTSSPVALTQEQIAKLKSELDIVTMNMSIFGEMLTHLKPGEEDPSDYRLLLELGNTCREMQCRIVELVGKVNNDEMTAELLRLNDELNNLFLRHQRYEKNRDPKAVQTPSSILGAALGVPASSSTNREKDSLIDFDDDASAANANELNAKFANIGLGTSQLSQINSVAAASGSTAPPISLTSKDAKEIDEFDLLAKSRKQSELGATKQVKHLSTAENTKESEFDEMAAWLDKDNTDAPEESLTSTEFDKFLAERAAVADNLPSISNNSSTKENNSDHQKVQRSEKDKDLMAL